MSDDRLRELYAIAQAGRPAGPGGEHPAPEAIAAARGLVDWRAVEVAPTLVRLARPGMAVTLKGIAQGYVTDRVADLLRAAGMTQVLVDLGEIRAVGGHPDGRPWRVGLEGTARREIELADMAVATSAGSGHATTVIRPPGLSAGTAAFIAGKRAITPFTNRWCRRSMAVCPSIPK